MNAKHLLKSICRDHAENVLDCHLFRGSANSLFVAGMEGRRRQTWLLIYGALYHATQSERRLAGKFLREEIQAIHSRRQLRAA